MTRRTKYWINRGWFIWIDNKLSFKNVNYLFIGILLWMGVLYMSIDQKTIPYLVTSFFLNIPTALFFTLFTLGRSYKRKHPDVYNNNIKIRK